MTFIRINTYSLRIYFSHLISFEDYQKSLRSLNIDRTVSFKEYFKTYVVKSCENSLQGSCG